MLNTSQLRAAWAPACAPKGTVFLDAYRALDACLARHGYAPRKVDTGAYSCRAITGGTGYSLHSYGPGDRFRFWNGLTIATSLAVDINWQTNPYGKTLRTDMPPAMVSEIKALRTNSGAQVWGWGGDYRTNKDAMHFEIVCSPADLASGIAGATPAPSEEDDMPLNDADKAFIKRTVDDSVNRAIGGVMSDEASDVKADEAEVIRDGSLKGWVVAMAKKAGVTRADAIREDPTHKKG